MSVLENAFSKARAGDARLVLPEQDDPRVAGATERLVQQGLGHIVPLAEPSDAHVAALVGTRGMKEQIARRMLRKPLVRAAAMVATGEADAMVAGAGAPTRRVIEAAGMAIGLDKGISVPTSFFLMVFPDGRELVFADCAVNVSPNADQLAAIARASAVSASALLGTARVAMLSFSTGTSGSGPEVDLVRSAAEITGFTGPVQADAALDATIAQKKGVVPVDANVLIFPSLDAGNIAYKLCQEFAGAQALGPFLQGFARPVCDLSRGASVNDIVNAAVLTVAQI